MLTNIQTFEIMLHHLLRLIVNVIMERFIGKIFVLCRIQRPRTSLFESFRSSLQVSHTIAVSKRESFFTHWYIINRNIGLAYKTAKPSLACFSNMNLGLNIPLE